MKVIYSSAILIMFLVIVSCNGKEVKETPKTVMLSGKVLNYEQEILFLSNNSENAMYLKEIIHKIPLNENNEFNYTLDLEKPQYFQTGRTFLYLTPGDSLNMTIDSKSRATAEFIGKGAEANLYLRNLPYPKGGSFFGDAREKKIDVLSKENMVATFKPILDERMATLENLKNVSEEFKALEKARLKFEYVNSLQSGTYLYIGDMMSKKMTAEEMNEKVQEDNVYLKTYVKDVLSSIDYNNIDYLQFEVFQGLLYALNDRKYTKEMGVTVLSPQLKEYVAASNLKQAFSHSGYTKEFTDYYDREIVKINNEEYRKSLDALVKKYEPLKTGQPAADVTFTDVEGKQIKMSDYAGKVVVVDLWATWCGPCMKEKPTFEKLVEKYKDNDNIALLSVSIDTRKIWTNYFEKEKAKGIQLHINRSDLSDYQIVGIPRFFVIDKDQNIVDVFAPLPSSGKLEEMFSAYL